MMEPPPRRTIKGDKSTAIFRRLVGMGQHDRLFLGFLLKHLIYGTVGGVVFGLLILWFDVAGLWTMIADSPDRELSLVLLFFGLFITFGSIGMAVGVMQLGEERD